MKTFTSFFLNIPSRVLAYMYRRVQAVRTKESGLTLVESLVAISILLIAVVGPMVIVSQALRMSVFARDQVAAFYLAHETVEYIRNIRDTNSMSASDPNDWLDNIVTLTPTTPPSLTSVDSSNLVVYQMTRGSSGYVFSACPSNVCPVLNQNTTTGIYGETSGTLKPSKYTREIIFYKGQDDDDGNREITVDVRVTWTHLAKVYEFRMQERLMNWITQNTSN